MYPSIISKNKYFPKHLGEDFLDLYEGFVNTRLKEKAKPKKERSMVIMEGYKLFVNGIYGKFNSDTSPFYDPLVSISTCVTGQLCLTMLTEEACLNIPNCKILQMNTDGATFRIPKKYLEKYLEICEKWEKKTMLTLEHGLYKKMIIRDVSNYLAEFESMIEYVNGEIKKYEYNSVKLKGCFEIDKELHKNPGMRIVPIALKEYFINNVPISETIRNHKDIYDFCLELKTNKDWQASYSHIDFDNNCSIESQNLGRITRYFISGNNGSLIKTNIHDGRITQVNRGHGIKIFNKYYYSDDYQINYNYYIREAMKIVEQIEDNQLSLF